MAKTFMGSQARKFISARMAAILVSRALAMLFQTTSAVAAPNASIHSPVSLVQLDNGVASLVADHLTVNLSPEMLRNFDLFVYVDKADVGPFAQRMFVLRKAEDSSLALLHDWPVSTGRETLEPDQHGQIRSTATPEGLYELDPRRLYVSHRSSQWHQEMPYAMFFDWKPNGRSTGLAIHGAPAGYANMLGHRASAGCIHLSVENARTLYEIVRSEFRGRVPRLNDQSASAQMTGSGVLLRDPRGGLQFESGYRVLVMVDGFTGEDRLSSLFTQQGAAPGTIDSHPEIDESAKGVSGAQDQ